MRDSIARALKRVRARLIPQGVGRHRACPAACTPRVPRPTTAPWPTPARPTRQPSYSQFTDPVFDGEQDMVRPYVLLYEEERTRQRQRRRALALALDGIDVGPRFIHGMEVRG